MYTYLYIYYTYIHICKIYEYWLSQQNTIHKLLHVTTGADTGFLCREEIISDQGRPQDFSQRGARFFRNKTLSGIRNKSKEKGLKLKKKGTKLKEKGTKHKKKGTTLKKKGTKLNKKESKLKKKEQNSIKKEQN